MRFRLLLQLRARNPFAPLLALEEAIEGKLRYRSYDDREGIKRYIVEVEADVIQLLGRKPDSQNQQSAGQDNQDNTGSYNNQSQSTDNDVSEDLTTRDPADDLPF